jgi:hypothetical protein
VAMRDVIWTVIVIWLIVKISSSFRRKTSSVRQHQNSSSSPHADIHGAEKDQHSGLKKGMDKEGEYVDFEELNS